MLIVGLILGWWTDRRRIEARTGMALQQETQRRTSAESGLSRLSTWYATNHALDDLPNELRELVGGASAEEVDPKSGFRIFRVANAATTLAHVGMQGDSFRIRGGPLRHEFVAEDLSGETPRVIFHYIGSENTTQRNTDGIITFTMPQTLFKPFRAGTRREPSDQAYWFTFAQARGAYRPVSVATKDVWPDWIYAPDGMVGPVHGGQLLERVVVVSPNEPVVMFSQEVSGTNGRRARVRLTITCQPQLSSD